MIVAEELIIILVICFTSIIQSLFGVGVLVFGTPLLLILGLDFIQTLNILLPISLAINLFQFINNTKSLDSKLVKDLAIIVLPTISITLFLGVQYLKFSLGLVVGFVLIIIACLNYFKVNFLEYINERIYLFIMAVTHGMTNLGGALLVGIISSKNFDKITTRTNISFFYFSFAFIQLITLSANNLLELKMENLFYSIAGVSLFFLCEKLIFVKINEHIFAKLTNTLLLILGILLMVNYFNK